MLYLKENLAFLQKLRGSDRVQLAAVIGCEPTLLSDANLEEGTLSAASLLKLADWAGYSTDALLRINLEKSARNPNAKTIKFLVLDVDGTLTDGGMYYSENGDQFKRFHAQDGMFIKRLTSSGTPVAFLSGGLAGGLVQRRADMLGVNHVSVQGPKPKLVTLRAWCADLGISLDEVAYIGDDVNDLEVMQHVGLTAAPADAVPVVRETAHINLVRRGGEGCVREFIEGYLVK